MQLKWKNIFWKKLSHKKSIYFLTKLIRKLKNSSKNTLINLNKFHSNLEYVIYNLAKKKN